MASAILPEGSGAEELMWSRALLASSAGVAVICPIIFVIFVIEEQTPRAMVEAAKDALLGLATAAVGCSLHVGSSQRRWTLYKTLNCLTLLSIVVETWVTFVSEGAESVVCGVLQIAVLVLLLAAGHSAQMLEDLARQQNPIVDSSSDTKRAAARSMSKKKRGTTEELEGLAGSAARQAMEEGPSVRWDLETPV